MTTPAASLPAFIEPMLAKQGTAFDSEEYLFEIKWDGTRALAFIEGGGYRLCNRRKVNLTDRYPEFAPLAQLPAGTIVDGEVVVLRDGKPDFSHLESREHTRNPLRMRMMAQTMPATYIIFDLLYANFEALTGQPFVERRALLQQLLKRLNCERFIFSDGVIGAGKAFFEQACLQDLEGMVAKRLQSRYLPGKRTDAWIKVKRGESVYCAIIGFTAKGVNDFRNLILATQVNGELHYCGKVGTGFDWSQRDKLNKLLWSRLRPKPLVPCKLKGKWIEPGLYCRVSCMERTEKGEFRAPVFHELKVEK
jgi:DNA ligase D-like protein (predicted ligase)